MSHTSSRLETYIGLALLLLAVLGFIFSMLNSLPKQEQVSSTARPLKEIPRDLFSGSNEINKTINGLNAPGGVPVTVKPDSLGKSNVFGAL